MNDSFLTFPARSESVDSWIEAWPLNEPGRITRFVLFLQQVVQSEDVELQLQPGGHYLFHVSASPSRVLEAVLQFSGAFPAEIRASASGRLTVRFASEPAAGSGESGGASDEKAGAATEPPPPAAGTAADEHA